MRKDFSLPEQDIDFLSSLGLPWETLRDGGNQWLIIHHFAIPDGYNHVQVRLALMIDPGYPVSQIDMVYFYPDLVLNSNKLIGALAVQPIDGLIWQRWSRHRTGENPWRPGVDDLSTHFSLINFWLEWKCR